MVVAWQRIEPEILRCDAAGLVGYCNDSVEVCCEEREVGSEEWRSSYSWKGSFCTFPLTRAVVGDLVVSALQNKAILGVVTLCDIRDISDLILWLRVRLHEC